MVASGGSRRHSIASGQASAAEIWGAVGVPERDPDSIAERGCCCFSSFTNTAYPLRVFHSGSLQFEP